VLPGRGGIGLLARAATRAFLARPLTLGFSTFAPRL
jgi:hypothetical protein